MEEREEIFRLRYEERLFFREIGQKLHKDKSAISQELNPPFQQIPLCYDCLLNAPYQYNESGFCAMVPCAKVRVSLVKVYVVS
ncbi:MAG: helix-turn-helix domain-containing protein [Spirochaetaceae bacterium]|nr:helix-turn-helix domain-containing protein [Spirochaetaceae bacterium]